MAKEELKDKLENATSNTASSEAVESVNDSSANNAEDLENFTKETIKATAKKVATETVTDQTAEQIYQEEKKSGTPLSEDEIKASARVYIKNTLGNTTFYESLTKDIENSLTSWIDSATKNSLGEYSNISSAINSVTSKISTTGEISSKITNTTTMINEKLSALEKNDFVQTLFDGTASANTSEKLHSLFSKVGIKGGDNVISYISNKVIGTMSGEKFLQNVFGDKNSIKSNIQNFQNFMNQMTETISKINEIVSEIQNKIYTIAQNAISTVLNTVKAAISAVVDSVVTAAIGTLKDSLSDAWKAGTESWGESSDSGGSSGTEETATT